MTDDRRLALIQDGYLTEARLPTGKGTMLVQKNWRQKLGKHDPLVLA